MRKSNNAGNILLMLVLVTGLAIVAMLARGGQAGSLDPAGPPGATDGVHQAGTPISSLPYTISEGGYYYVTRNLNAGGAFQSGITIAASNVTLDLGGFTLFGGTSPLDGITANGPRYVTVMNGNVRGWDTGIDLQVTYSRVVNVRATNNVSHGIKITGESVVEDCVASLNGVGIATTAATIRRCTTSENAGTGIVAHDRNVIEDNRITAGLSYGLYMDGDFNTVRGNEFSANGTLDIWIAGDSNALFENVWCDQIVDDGANNFVSSGNFKRLAVAC